MMRIQYGIIKHRFKSLLPESLHIFFYYISFERTVHDIITGRFRIPYTKTAVMFGRQTAITHLGRFSCFRPLVTIQFHRIKDSRTGIGVSPVVTHKSRNIKVDKHSEFQIDKLLLQSAQIRSSIYRLCFSLYCQAT